MPLRPVADVAVIGAGLAGLTAATRLAREGLSVVVYEEGQLPRHRVCGEYVSLEVIPFLRELGLDVFALGAKELTRFELSSRKGRTFRSALDLGGFGLSRYRLDEALLDLARKSGAQVVQGARVRNVIASTVYRVECPEHPLVARVVLGCFGKRSRLDATLKRPNARRRSPYVAVKRHYRGKFPSDLVGLHVVPGGYCGISAVEEDVVNVCCLTDSQTLKRQGGLTAFEHRGLRENPVLADYLDQLTPLFAAPLVISQVDFAAKQAVHDHVLMLGDAAGMIHPLAGNGMAMALRAAATVTPLVQRFLDGQLKRAELEAAHAQSLQRQFRARVAVSRGLQRLFESRRLSEALCSTANALPSLARLVIRSTHGSQF